MKQPNAEQPAAIAPDLAHVFMRGELGYYAIDNHLVEMQSAGQLNVQDFTSVANLQHRIHLMKDCLGIAVRFGSSVILEYAAVEVRHDGSSEAAFLFAGLGAFVSASGWRQVKSSWKNRAR